MKRFFIGILLLLAVTVVWGREMAKRPTVQFPKPHYERHDDDPAWIQAAANFHGHLGPAIVIGARLGVAGLAAVEAHGYFDVEVVCEGPFAAPPQSCMIDGIQISTGATLGKKNLTVLETKEYVVRIKNRKNGKSAVLRPKPELLQLAWSQLHNDDDHDHDGNTKKSDPIESMRKVEAIARRIASTPDDEMMSIEQFSK